MTTASVQSGNLYKLSAVRSFCFTWHSKWTHLRWVFQCCWTSSRSFYSKQWKQKRKHSVFLSTPGWFAPKFYQYFEQFNLPLASVASEKWPQCLNSLIAGRCAINVAWCATCNKCLNCCSHNILCTTVSAHMGCISTERIWFAIPFFAFFCRLKVWNCQSRCLWDHFWIAAQST